MKFVLILIVGYFGFMVSFGLWSLCIFFGWIEEPQPPEPQPLNKPVHIGLPEKVAMMEWEVLGSSTKAIHVEDINNEPINLN